MTTITSGTILADTYEITEQIGSGGGGIVFKGRHLRLGTDIIVKKIKDEVVTWVDTQNEANLLKNLKHQYLPKVYDFIEGEDGVYTVMDFINGDDMDTTVRRHGKYPQKQVLKWAQQLGSALEYLHNQKVPIIHSDIKPANIMMTPEGDVCLIDFNISLAMGEDAKKVAGISVGYSPPEQYQSPEVYRQIVRGYTSKGKSYDEAKRRTAIMDSEEASERMTLMKKDNRVTAEARCTKLMGGKIDTRSDIYSLGMTLYFLLTATEPPVDFEQRGTLGRPADISEGLMLVLEKMTELSPDDRYPNGGRFLNALNNCYKLDRRYAAMRRKETAMQAAALALMFCGTVMILSGRHMIQAEINSAYYETMKSVGEAIGTYDYDEAKRLIDEAKNISSGRIEAYEQEVYMRYANEDYEDCVALAELYINSVPFAIDEEADKEVFGNIYYISGNAYFELGDYANAKKLFEGAITYNDGSSVYFRDYAITLAKLGQADEAQRQLENGIGLGMADDSVYMAQGEIAYVRGEHQEAVSCLEKAIQTTDDMQMKSRAVLLCAEIYRSGGEDELDRQITLLEQYAQQPDISRNFAITEYLAEAYSQKAAIDEAQSDYYWQKALSLFQDLDKKGYATYQLQENMAILYENLDKFDEAEELLLKMGDNYPKRYEVYKRLAYLEADRQQMKENKDRDYAKMRVYYDKASELYPDNGQDMEMQMLDNMMQELKDGGWF